MAYTNIPKPTGTGYTNIAKPSDGGTMQIKAGMITGLMIPLTYAVTYPAVGASAYVRVSKPTGTGYTNIAKPT